MVFVLNCSIRTVRITSNSVIVIRAFRKFPSKVVYIFTLCPGTKIYVLLPLQTKLYLSAIAIKRVRSHDFWYDQSFRSSWPTTILCILSLYIYLYRYLSVIAQQIVMDRGLLIIEASLSHSDTQHSAGLL